MKARPIFFRTRSGGPRLQYVVSELFERRLGFKAQIVLSAESIPENAFETGYGSETGFFPDSGILSESKKNAFQLSPHSDFRKASLSDGEGKKTFGDLPGMAFWLLSRYQEYTLEKDVHGRFPEEEIIQVKHGLEEIPLIERWLWQWLQELPEKDRPETFNSSKKLICSFDIDNLTAYQYKGWWRGLGGSGKDFLSGDVSKVVDRIEVLINTQKDPYDTLPKILRETRSFPEPVPFFIWTGDYGIHDKGLSYQHPFFKQRIREIARQHPVGLHPSYASFHEPERLIAEKQRLENLLDKPLIINRFHFLRFRLPQSYRQLLDVGFQEDWSMGFSNRYGFRAGTGNPFFWYDLEKETSTLLLLTPFLAMDSAAYHKQHQTAEAYSKKISGLMSVPDTVSYTSCVVLHNEFPTWEGWQNLLPQLRTYG